MGRYCTACGNYCSPDDFSSNQWRKGEGYSRCMDCVFDNQWTPTIECQECGRIFSDQNQLKMHMQTHRPRNFSCPICGEQRFRSGANAVQHVESGYCAGCSGKQNARNQIYRFASRQQAMRPYMTHVPMLTNGGYEDDTPDFPYQCQHCVRSFRQLSQLLQHNDAKHNEYQALTYY